jgi:hypothetical protein
MSKTKDKREARKAEAESFVKERRQVQMAVFESNFNVGLDLYERTKDKMSKEELALIEAEIARNRKLIDEWKERWGSEEE